MGPPDVILVIPPMNVQVTHPDIGVPQLTAHLRRLGFSVLQHDLNMAFMYRHLADPDVVSGFLDTISRRSGRDISGLFLDSLLESIGLAMSESRPPDLRPEMGPDVRGYMNRRAARLNILSNVQDLEVDVKVLGRRGAWKGFVEMVDGIHLQPRSFTEKDLLAAARSEIPLLETFYERFLDSALEAGAPRLLGISIGSTTQLLPALVLARMARARELMVVAGGPWCSAARDLLPGLGSLRRYLDAAVIHEGERPLVEILGRLERSEPLGSIDGVVVPGKEPAAPPVPVPLEELAPPEYDGMNIDLHPVPAAPVRLTRGCHWARCDFCHHVFPGYTELHASTEASISDGYIDGLVDHIEDLKAGHGVEQIFLSDNGPPWRLLHRFASRLLERDTSIHWESLARFEPELTVEACRDVAASGCRGLYFGLETSSVKELGALAKGIDLEVAERCLEMCAQAGVWSFVFVLCHPLQTLESYRETFEWLKDRFDSVTQVIAFRFTLARFSRAYRKRNQMGIRLRRGASSNLDVFAVPYTSDTDVPLDAFIDLTERYETELRNLRSYPPPMTRACWNASQTGGRR
jgi:hypothetical protein